MAESGHAQELVNCVLDNLKHQHDWTALQVHREQNGRLFPRPLISGLPPRRLYLHPDDQVEMIKARRSLGDTVVLSPEVEWILPTHLSEQWSLSSFAAIFDAMQSDGVPPSIRPKRVLLATVHDDSTIVYYLLHDGIVKPRQN